MSAMITPVNIRPYPGLKLTGPFFATVGKAMPAKLADRPKRDPKPKRRYALGPELPRAIAAVRACGIAIVTVDLRTDGTIRLSSAVDTTSSAESEFDHWDKAGKL